LKSDSIKLDDFVDDFDLLSTEDRDEKKDLIFRISILLESFSKLIEIAESIKEKQNFTLDQ